MLSMAKAMFARLLIRPWVVMLASLAVSAGWLTGAPGSDSAADDHAPSTSLPRLITKAAQFRDLPAPELFVGCAFHLNGVLTFIDTNRNLLVLQDPSGAVAINVPVLDSTLFVGQKVTIKADRCTSYFARFPDFPFRPAEKFVLPAFECPRTTLEYRLTRLRGYLQPPVTGEYSFWIASDNSSELWLSTDDDPAKIRRIASIQRFGWVNQHEWSHYPSQHSDQLNLIGGKRYYIEAFLEQTTGHEHLSVAWQGPGLNQAIIDAQYLAPAEQLEEKQNGILRESWTNYTAGDLEGVVGFRQFDSVITVKQAQITPGGTGMLPEPVRINPGQRLPRDGNYLWVRTQGEAKFVITSGESPGFELSDGERMVQVRVPQLNSDLVATLRSGPIRVDGVCEGTTDQNGVLTPGIIWASGNSIVPLETAPETTNSASPIMPLPQEQPGFSYTDVQAFFGTRGAVTFNNSVLGNDYLFVQKDAEVVLVDFPNFAERQRLRIGTWLDLGGGVKPSKYSHIPIITPLVVKELGWFATPMPIAQPVVFPIPASQEGRWSEFEGVVQSVNTNGTLVVQGTNGALQLWLEKSTDGYATRYIDARVRARGVLLLSLQNTPLLLVPNLSFLAEETPPPKDLYSLPPTPISAVLAKASEVNFQHRVRINGAVTYADHEFFFIQDASGAIRVKSPKQTGINVGDTLEVVGFPPGKEQAGTLTEPHWRQADSPQPLLSRELEFNTDQSFNQLGTLVHVSGNLLSLRTNGSNQILELQEQHRIFTAVLTTDRGLLANMIPGSRLQITGVCNDEAAMAGPDPEKPHKPQILSSINLLLRTPQDVKLLRGPPWWTWRRTASLVGLLFLVLMVTLLWVHLLRRRLHRQQAAQLAFAYQVLKRLEDERRRIAVNLHDSLGQVLLLIKNHALLAMQPVAGTQDVQRRLTEISQVTSQAIEEVREITHGLRPYQLDRLGLTQALRALVDHATQAAMSDKAISFACRVEEVDGLFDPDAEIHVYRIVQEAVTNVVKHAAATEATVVVKRRSDIVLIAIRDNGRGFEPSQLNARLHELGYGLTGISERARILHASLEIDSRPGNGASLTVEIPLATQKL